MNITYVLLQTKKATLSAPAISILVEACHELRVLDHLSNPYRQPHSIWGKLVEYIGVPNSFNNRLKYFRIFHLNHYKIRNRCEEYTDFLQECLSGTASYKDSQNEVFIKGMETSY